MSAPSTILIAEDDPGARALVGGILGKEGYKLVFVGDGASALETAIRVRPDVVLLDVMLPEMDGFSVSRALRSHPQLAHVPILLLTALDDRASRLRGLETGADDFLTKPLDGTELRMRLRTITRLNRYRLMVEERSLYERLVELAPDGIAVVDGAGCVSQCNGTFRSLVDHDPTGEVFKELLGEGGAEALAAHLASVAAGGRRPEPFEATLRAPRVPGTLVDIAAASVQLKGRSALQLIVRDITERKGLETQLLRSQRIELLGQLAGGIVHDVNNLLTLVMYQAEFLEMDNPGDAAPRLKMIKSSVERSTALLRQLLGFARGTDGEISPIAPAEVLLEVSSMVRTTFDRQVFRVEIDCPGRLPTVAADPNQLHQVLTNLCVNARDAMPSGGRLTLGGAVRRVDEAAAAREGPGVAPGDYVVLSVADTGEGMTPEVRRRLFDPFFTTKPPGKGTGLGLATVLRLIKRHRGFITVDTEVGRGTTFACHIPVLPDPATETPSE